MADPSDRFEDNAPGPWYVDRECIFCNVCIERAPATFREAEDGTHDYVFRQPGTPEEIDAARRALEDCPVEAIGDDG